MADNDLGGRRVVEPTNSAGDGQFKRQPRAAAAIANFTFWEGIASRLPAIFSVLVVSLYLLSLFVGQLAIAEEAVLRVAFLAGGLRLAGVGVVILHVAVMSANWETTGFADTVRAVEVTPIAFLAGRLFGFAGTCAIGATLCGLVLLPVADTLAALGWTVTFCGELILLAAFTLFLMVSLKNVVAAGLTAAMFYVLARSMSALLLLGAAGAAPDTPLRVAITQGLRGFSLVLPRLDRFARTEWLIYGYDGWSEFATPLLSTLAYGALLMGCGLFDSYRRR